MTLGLTALAMSWARQGWKPQKNFAKSCWSCCLDTETQMHTNWSGLSYKSIATWDKFGFTLGQLWQNFGTSYRWLLNFEITVLKIWDNFETKGLATFTQLVKVRRGKLVLALASIRFSWNLYQIISGTKY